jgi:acetoin utilization deacetylase AcuC-like enzyme
MRRRPVAFVGVTVLLSSAAAFAEHDTGPGHPERPARLDAVLAGVDDAGLGDELVRVVPRPATRRELATVHDVELVDALERFCAGGGGAVDADTVAVPRSWPAARLAAGSGIDATERLRAGEARAAFCAVRPPGHHATPVRAMGFCLLNSAAVTAAVLADAGERVLLVDWDAHHGNGTQDAFWSDPRVLYVSLHQHPLYPGSGWLADRGEGDAVGTTINLPLPAGATGDVYLAAFDEVIAPAAEEFGPTWVLVSAGFDAHRSDPLTDLGLTSGDFADLTSRVLGLAPPGRLVLFLEGGYDLVALRASAAATIGALAGTDVRTERATSGGPGIEVVHAAAARLTL